jgi:hypothetical protein
MQQTDILMLICYGTFLLPFAALLGFYDNRKNGEYHFRTVRFVMTMLILIAFFVYCVIPFTYGIRSDVLLAINNAETGVAKTRAIQVHLQDDLSAVFPDILTSQTSSCYTNAIANYVEDQWKQDFFDSTCKKGSNLCSDNERDFFEKTRSLKNANGDSFVVDLGLIDEMLGRIWTTASTVYKKSRSFEGIIAPSHIGQPRVGTDRQAYEIYHQHLLNCASLQPVDWTVLKAPLIKTPATFCIGDCP